MVLALDTETALIGRGIDLAPPLACISYCRDIDFVPGLYHANQAHDWLKEVLESDEIITGANFAFDACVLIRAFPDLVPALYSAYRAGRIIDVQLNQRLIDLAQGCLDGYRHPNGAWIDYKYSLAALHERYEFGALEKGADTYRLRYGELIPLPLEQWPEAATEYAKLDALATLKVYLAQQAYPDLLKDSPNQSRKALVLQKMSWRGFVTDMKTCLEYLGETKTLLEESKLVCMKEGLLWPEGTKPRSKVGKRNTVAAKARMEKICSELGIEPKRTATDGISLDAEATRDTGDHVLKAYSRLTSATSILNKVTELQEGAKGLPLQTSFDVLKSNGRCSSRKPKAPLVGVQMQNLPREGRMRNCFVARPGYGLLSIDFNMHELVTVSQCQLWLTGASKLAEALNEGRDVHCDVGAILMGATYEDMLAGKKAKSKPHVLARNQSKEVNFGGWGVMTAHRLMLQMNKKRQPGDALITLERAEEIMGAWEKRWEPQSYFEAVAAMFPEGNQWSVTTIRQFISERVRGLVAFPDACNGLFSGLAADAVAEAIWRIDDACTHARAGEPLYDCHQLLVVHDETVAEVPLKTLHASAYEMTRIFVETAQKYTPDVKLNAAPAAMLAYDKNADAVFKDGELQLWSP